MKLDFYSYARLLFQAAAAEEIMSLNLRFTKLSVDIRLRTEDIQL